MGRDFATVWNNPHCPIELKKKIARTVIEEIIANQDRSTGRLSLVVRRHSPVRVVGGSKSQ